MMSKTMGVSLLVYGICVAGLAWAIHEVAPGRSMPTLITGLAGGALSCVWGIRWMRGRGRKVWPVLTLVGVCYMLLARTVAAWSEDVERTAAVLTTLALAGSFAMLLRVVYFGVFSPRPSEKEESRPARSGSTANPPPHAYPAKAQ